MKKWGLQYLLHARIKATVSVGDTLPTEMSPNEMQYWALKWNNYYMHKPLIFATLIWAFTPIYRWTGWWFLWLEYLCFSLLCKNEEVHSLYTTDRLRRLLFIFLAKNGIGWLIISIAHKCSLLGLPPGTITMPQHNAYSWMTASITLLVFKPLWQSLVYKLTCPGGQICTREYVTQHHEISHLGEFE
jgi:hypothetical protein